jgi:hypothetical protein
VVDHDAVAFVKELLGEDDGAGISGEDGRAGRGAEVGALVDAGQLAVEGSAGAKAVGGGGFDGARKLPDQRGRVAPPSFSAAAKASSLALEAASMSFRSSGPGSTNFGSTVMAPVR